MIGCKVIRIQDWLAANKALCKLTGLKRNEVNFKFKEWGYLLILRGDLDPVGKARNLRRPICVYLWTDCEWR
ncbi:hypothetical protein FGIG_09312 [Fasciola gigantica]|uniref:Uncharacterized protein n=1 Tax=Fasciola gigantica TaxID=46835 RepID=A0A504WY88_FASGI|nr:hypothetical protein FGIG_09312 [Fasciola gigantica]